MLWNRMMSVKSPGIIVFIAHLPLVLTLGPPAFISDWKPIAANGIPSEVELTVPHGLGGLPMKVQVQVRVQHLSEYIYFNAINSAQSGTNSSDYGGVIYMFNENDVKIIAPGPANCFSACNGYVVYLGDSDFVGPANVSRKFKAAEVRVRAWDMCTFGKPAYMNNLLIQNDPLYNFQEIDTLINKIELLITHIHLGNGYVIHAEDSASILTTDNALGGVMIAYSNSKIRIWTPARGNGVEDANGVPFSAVNGWGQTGEFFNETGQVNVQFFGYRFSDFTIFPRLFKLEINKGAGTQDLQNFDATSDLDTDTVFTFLTMSPEIELEVDGNFGYEFMVPGSSLAGSAAKTGQFGSLVFGYAKRTIYMWRPSDESDGCIIAVGGLWGGGNMAECSERSIVTAVGVDSNFVEDVCQGKGCSATDIGPVCDCGGNGFEGQFCDIPISCPPPTGHNVSNVYYSPMSLAYGFQDIVNFYCILGYEPVNGSLTRGCTHNKTWSNDSLVCDRVSCGEPDILDPNSFIWYKPSIVFQGVVKYACGAGFSIESGNLIRVCQANRTWSGIAPICNVTCGVPVDYGGVRRTTFGDTIGRYANYTCAVGYENPNGSMSRYCHLDGNWDGTPPSCSIKYCLAPEPGIDSEYNYTTLYYGSSTYYKCKTGFVSTEDLSTTMQTSMCQDDKTWSLGPLNCTRVQCPLPSVGMFVANFPTDPKFYEDNITFQCIIGKMLGSGDLVRTCQSNGTWSGEMPSCQDVKCPSLGNITKGSIITTGNVYGSQAVAVCEDGAAVMSGDMVRMCNENGAWIGNSGSDPVCQDILRILWDLGGNGYLENFTFNADDLTLDPTTLSKYKRSKKSILYYYPSHRGLGYLGIFILAAVCLYICSLDLINLTRAVKRRLLNKVPIKKPPKKVYNVYITRK